MAWLSVVLHLFIGSTLAGCGVIAALVSGHDSAPWLIGAAVGGFLFAIPISWGAARSLLRR